MMLTTPAAAGGHLTTPAPSTTFELVAFLPLRRIAATCGEWAPLPRFPILSTVTTGIRIRLRPTFAGRDGGKNTEAK